tara:strand:- start:762 stop:917 length:156 start_codon:yes stop_codon:yes gene_type:complete
MKIKSNSASREIFVDVIKRKYGKKYSITKIITNERARIRSAGVYTAILRRK